MEGESKEWLMVGWGGKVMTVGGREGEKPFFSNPNFFEPPSNSNQKLFTLPSQTPSFYP